MDPTNSNLSRRSFLKGLIGWLGGHRFLSGTLLSGAGLVAWAQHDTLTLKKEVWDLYYPRLPAAMDGLTIVQLSDLHMKTLRIPLDEIVEAVHSVSADLLVLTGDLIDISSDIDHIADFLQSLQARYGKYICMGNNDYTHFSRTLFKRYLRLLVDAGWTPLLNDAKYLKQLNLCIIGVDDPATARDDVPLAYSRSDQSLSSATDTSEQNPPPWRLVLSHSTDCLDDILRLGAELFLSGHTHAGQIRFPGSPPIVNNTLLGTQKIFEGLHLVEGIPVYINRGIGTSVLPIRLSALPEIAVFRLHHASQDASSFSFSKSN